MIEREEEILKLLADNKSKAEICEHLANKHKVGVRSIESQYYDVVNKMYSQLSDNRSEIGTTLLMRKDAIYKKAFGERKYQVALNALMAIARMANLYDAKAEKTEKPTQINITERDYSKPLQAVGDDSNGDS